MEIIKKLLFTDKKISLTNDERNIFNSLPNSSFKISVIDITSDSINDIVIKISFFNSKHTLEIKEICLYKYWGKMLWQGNRYIIPYDTLNDELKTDLVISSTMGLNIEVISNTVFSMTMVYELVQRQYTAL
ncbi:MAG: hypothetical protein ACYDEC_17730 [Bacteroidia bacterium]